MTTDSWQRRLQRAKRKQRAQFLQRWFVDEVFLAAGTRRFQYKLSVLFVVTTWTAIVLGVSFWAGRRDVAGTLGAWPAIALIALIGMGSLAGGVGYVLYMRRVLCWPQARARVARYWIKRYNDESVERVVYHPVLIFRTAEGKEAISISRSGSPHKSWPTGAEVLLHYNPRHPVHAEVSSLLRRNFLAIGMGVLFTVTLTTCVIYVIISHL